MAAPRGNDGYVARRGMTALERFISFCRFVPETGCVVWTGGQTKGRGHSIPYPSFWYAGKGWLGHRWAAKFIHGLDIDGFHVDHCCPHTPTPNTLCVQHVQAITPRENRELQHSRRKHFIHLQVGITDYEDVYGYPAQVPAIPEDSIPFHEPPAWLNLKGETNGISDCPF
jgi:hypothetical protein